MKLKVITIISIFLLLTGCEITERTYWTLPSASRVTIPTGEIVYFNGTVSVKLSAPLDVILDENVDVSTTDYSLYRLEEKGSAKLTEPINIDTVIYKKGHVVTLPKGTFIYQ